MRAAARSREEKCSYHRVKDFPILVQVNAAAFSMVLSTSLWEFAKRFECRRANTHGKAERAHARTHESLGTTVIIPILLYYCLLLLRNIATNSFTTATHNLRGLLSRYHLPSKLCRAVSAPNVSNHHMITSWHIHRNCCERRHSWSCMRVNKVYGGFEQFWEIQHEKKRKPIPQEAEDKKKLNLDLLVFVLMPSPCSKGLVDSENFAYS